MTTNPAHCHPGPAATSLRNQAAPCADDATGNGGVTGQASHPTPDSRQAQSAVSRDHSAGDVIAVNQQRDSGGDMVWRASPARRGPGGPDEYSFAHRLGHRRPPRAWDHSGPRRSPKRRQLDGQRAYSRVQPAVYGRDPAVAGSASRADESDHPSARSRRSDAAERTGKRPASR